MILRPQPPAVGAAGAASVAVAVEPLLPLSSAVHGLVVGIVAAHGYAAGVLLARVAGVGRPGEVGVVAAAGAAALLSAASDVVVAGVAAAVLLLVVLLARGARAVGRSIRSRSVAGLGSAVCLLVALPGVVAAGAPAGTALGPEGRAFLLAGTGNAVRVYAGLGGAPTLPERAAGAVAALEAAGGLTRSTVLVAVPTGSGWVNEAGVAGLERLAAGGTATVVLQYARRPSWQEYASGSGAAEASAVALVRALRDRLDALPAAQRPRLLVHGESLGALGAAAAADAADGVLVSGMPGGAWGPAAGVTSVLHVDDPVGWFSPRLLVARPDGWPGEWLPVVSFWTTVGSLLVALDAPAGHGHRYAGELADGWRAVLARG